MIPGAGVGSSDNIGCASFGHERARNSRAKTAAEPRRRSQWSASNTDRTVVPECSRDERNTGGRYGGK